jgi:chromosome segregation ATPase
VHITETPPPSGVAVDNVMNNPTSSPPSSRQNGQAQSQSIGDWEVRQAEVEVRQAQQQLQTAEKNAQQAEMQAQETIQRSEQFIDTHDKNQYMRRVFKFQLKQAKNAAEDAGAKTQEVIDQLTQAEQQYQAAQQQLKEAQEDAKIFRKLNQQ